MTSIPGKVRKIIKNLLSRRRFIAVLVAIAVIGTASLIFSSAASSSVAFEAESGARTGGGSVIPEANASGGNAVKFSSVVNGWNLYWADEFNGNTINTSVWRPYNNTYGDGNFETHCLTPNNLGVADGSLKIITKQETVTCPSYGRSNGWATPNRNYTSGFVGSRETGTYFPKYARYEVRAKSPQRLGLVPAIWLRHINGSSTMELDLMESFQGSAPGSVTSTIHAQNSTGIFRVNAWKSGQTIGTTQDWHIWAVEIEPLNNNTEVEIRYYLDGRLLNKNGGGGAFKIGGQGKVNTFDNIGEKGFDIALNTAVNFNHSGNASPDSPNWYCPSSSGWTKVASPSQAMIGWRVAETPMKNLDGSTFYRACMTPQLTKAGGIPNNPAQEIFEIDYVRVYTK